MEASLRAPPKASHPGRLTEVRRAQTSKDDPAQVAREGFEALMAGKDHVVAGSAKNKAQVAAGRDMPETVKAGTQARQTQPGSGTPGLTGG